MKYRPSSYQITTVLLEAFLLGELFGDYITMKDMVDYLKKRAEQTLMS